MKYKAPSVFSLDYMFFNQVFHIFFRKEVPHKLPDHFTEHNNCSYVKNGCHRLHCKNNTNLMVNNKQLTRNKEKKLGNSHVGIMHFHVRMLLYFYRK